MKHLTKFLFLFLAFNAGAQDITDVVFDLDTLSIDSFFLVESKTFTADGSARSETHETPVFFSDTMAFNLYIDARKQRLADLLKQRNQIATEYIEVDAQITDLETLRDSVFRGVTFGGFIRQLQPEPALSSTFSVSTATSWLIYEDPRGKAFGTWFVPYKPDVPIKNDGYLLKSDGTFERVRKNQKKGR